MANLIKFRHFNTLSAFNQRTIAEGDLCFISEDKSIRTHSEVYMCSKDVKDITKDNDNGLIISYNNGTSKTITLKGDFLKLSNSYIPNSSNIIGDLTVSAGDTVDTAIGKLAKLITLSNAATSTTLGTINDRLDALDQDFVTEQELTDAVNTLEAANTALDGKLDTIESSYVKSIKGASGSGSNTGLSITIGPTNKTTEDVNLTVTIDDTQLMSKISGVWHFKGVKNTISSLPSSGNQIGDVWQVIENNGEYAWNGTNWVELGLPINLSEYKIKDLVQNNGDKGITLTLNNNGKLNVSVTPGQIQNGNTSIITGGLVYNAIENLKGSATTNGDTLGKLENKINTLINEGVDMNNYYTKSDVDSNFLSINTSIPQASNSIPLMDGIGSIGSANNFARGDHKHPSDSAKQDKINDLDNIRAGANAGSTAYQKPQTGIPKAHLESSVQESLNKAESSLQPGDIPANLSEFTNDVGYITNAGVTSFNGSTGAITYTPPITSVNGQTGNVILSIPEVQIQSDWNATTGMGVILNKPIIPTITFRTWTL